VRDGRRLTAAPAGARHEVALPTVTLHTTGDGGAVPDQERWLAEQMRDPRMLRQLYVDRGTRCAVDAAEELVALGTVFARIESGHWRPG
jgi:hypothetical protein